MIEIAVDILSQKPEANIEPARYWAVDVIKAYATKVPLSPQVQRALIENRALKSRAGSCISAPGTDNPIVQPQLQTPSKAQ